MINKLFIDFETFSTYKIQLGSHKYIEGAELLICTYAWNDEPVQYWDVMNDPEGLDGLIPYLMRQDKVLVAHNGINFDRLVKKNLLSPDSSNDIWIDTMVLAYQHGLPGRLGILCSIFNLNEDEAKLKDGKKLINLFCKIQGKNRKIKRCNKQTHPKEWNDFIKYAIMDIESMRIIYKKIPKWNMEIEKDIQLLDMKINDRGFRIDFDLVNGAIRALEIEKNSNDNKTQDQTHGEVQAATQRDALLKFILKQHGVSLPDLKASTINRRLEDPDLPEPIKDLLRIRQQSAKTSNSKYNTLIKTTSSDGRLRGTLQYCGAPRTGRWSGRKFQPQNMPRPSFKKDVVEEGITALKNDYADFIFENVNEVCASALRGCLIPEKGNKIVASDLKSIEGRVLAWLANEEWKVQAYRDIDKGIGYDMYVLTYANTFGVDPSTVTDIQRQLGKVLELALGYGGGVGAFISFAKVYHIDLQIIADMLTIPDYIYHEAERWYDYSKENKRTFGLSKEVFIACDSIKRLWRESNSNIVAFWDACYYAFKKAVFGYNEDMYDGKCSVDKVKSWVRIRLPSGRFMCYPSAKMRGKDITYLGMNTYTRKWGRIKTYGGKIAENITQAVSRDVLAYGMLNTERAGYNIILTVHDEIITEVPDNVSFNHEHLSKIMSINPPWAYDLPLNADGFEGYRYRKD